jgi:hypothetical protein
MNTTRCVAVVSKSMKSLYGSEMGVSRDSLSKPKARPSLLAGTCEQRFRYPHIAFWPFGFSALPARSQLRDTNPDQPAHQSADGWAEDRPQIGCGLAANPRQIGRLRRVGGRGGVGDLTGGDGQTSLRVVAAILQGITPPFLAHTRESGYSATHARQCAW